MDSSEVLDLLGNENRRKILELLAYKPCYVTEISEYIGVSPKAVIDHLKMLEEAGLIESRVDDKRRKYFYITRNLRLEVSVSPYSFGVKSGYPRSNIKKKYEYIKLKYRESREDTQSSENEEDFSDLVSNLERLEKIENELSIAQRQVQSQITEIMKKIEDRIESKSQNPLQAEVLTTLIDSNEISIKKLSEEMGISEEILRENLRDLEEKDIVERDEEEEWVVSD